MNLAEFAPIAADIQARWWAFPIPPSALDQYVIDLHDLDADAVRAAVATLGDREKPPTSGQIRRRVAELELDAPAWDQARAAVIAWWRGRDQRKALAASWECPAGACDGSTFVDIDANTVTDCECRPAFMQARRGLVDLHPMVRQFIEDGHATNRDLLRMVDEHDTTAAAQMRDRWMLFCGRAIDSRVLAGPPAAPALRRIEAARSEDDDRRERFGELRRPDVQALIGPGR